MSDIVERARARLKHIKDDGDAVLIDMLVTDNERLRAALREIMSLARYHDADGCGQVARETLER